MARGAILEGRDEELAIVATALAERRPCALVGESGIGKTTILRAAIASSGLRPTETGGLATLRWVPRFVLARALGRTELAGDLEGAASLVERAVGDGVLLFDDVQWADLESVRALPYLVGRIPLLAAIRRDDPDAEAAVEALEGAGFDLVELGELEEDACVRLVESERPDLPASVVTRIVRGGGGNPLLLRELALAGEPSVSFRRAVAGRLRSLSDIGLDAVALLGLAEHALEDDGAAEYGEAVERGFCERVGTAVQLRHGLIGEVAVEQLDVARKVTLHARLARLVSDPAEVAHHFSLAGDRVSAHGVALDAAEEADVLGIRAALLGLAAANADGGEADVLRLRAAEALCEAGDFRGVESALNGLETKDPELRALAALFRSRALWDAGDDESYRREIEDALEAVTGCGSKVEARVRIESVRLPLILDNDPVAALEQADAAVALAREAGVDEHRALNMLGVAHYLLEGENWEGPFTDAIRVAREQGDGLTELYAANNLVSAHESAGDPRRGREIAATASARAVELGLVSVRRQLDASAINLDLHAGHYERVIDQGEALLAELVEQRTIDQIVLTLGLAYVDTGRFKRAVELANRLEATTGDRLGSARPGWLRAELELWAGRPLVAVEAADAFLALPDLADDIRLLVHVPRAWALSVLGRDGATELPESHVRLTVPIAMEITALQLLSGGEPADAAGRFLEAAERFTGLHLRGELRTRYAAGEALRRAGEGERAREILLDAEREAESHGMQPLLAWIHRSLRLLGERRAAPRGTGDLLTPRERELLVLVGEGLSNPEIARRLGLSRRTVETELRSASGKLGASSRAQAAVLAAPG